MVGFRTFIKNSADSFDISGFAENLPDGSVKIVCEGEKAKKTEYISYIKQESPSFAAIDDIKVDYGAYKGEFSSFKRRGADVPSDDGAVLAVLKRMEILDTVKQDTGEMTDTLSFLKAVYHETLELKEKYEVLSRDVAAIKVKLKAG